MGTRGPATNRGSLWEVFFFLDPNQRVSPEGRRQGEGRRLQEGGNGRSARAKCWTGATGASGLE